jgi:hypothetical protein
MIPGDAYIWAPPGAVPQEGVVKKVSKAEKWVDLQTNKGVLRVALPNGFLFKVRKEEQ